MASSVVRAYLLPLILTHAAVGRNVKLEMMSRVSHVSRFVSNKCQRRRSFTQAAAVIRWVGSWSHHDGVCLFPIFCCWRIWREKIVAGKKRKKKKKNLNALEGHFLFFFWGQMSSSKFSPTSSVRERRSISIIISKLLTGRRKKKIAQGLLWWQQCRRHIFQRRYPNSSHQEGN